MESAPRANRVWAVGSLLGALALALAVRAAPTSRVLTPAGVLLAADGDTYYHALRAERIARDWPSVPWDDPGMNHPYGAEIPWPPLLDQILATAAVATGTATEEHVARVAALVAPALGVLLVALAAAAEAGIARGPGWQAALLLALLPAAVRQSFVGRPDHHVLEVLLSLAALLALASAARRDSPFWRCSAALGAALALAFWNWAGSALYLPALAGCVAVLHLALPPGDPAPRRAASALACGAAVAAALLGVSIAAWGPPGALARLTLTPITGLSIVLSALTALAAGGLALARQWDPRAGSLRRAAHLAAAACLPLLALLALPAARRGGLSHGFVALGASSPWYSAIAEFWPLLLSGRQPWSMELRLALLSFGLAPLLLVPAAFMLRRSWTRDPERRPDLLFLAAWTVGAVALALLRRRFEGYAAVPIAVTGAWALREASASDRLPRAPWPAWARAAAVGAVLIVAAAPGLPLVLRGDIVEPPDGAEDKVPLLRWLRDAPSPPGREGVLSTWANGHEIRWLARKPVVSTPFGTDIDERSIRDEAAFFAELRPEGARSLLERRRVGFLLLENPVREVATMSALAPGSPSWAIEERGVGTGSRYAMREEFFDLVASRLYFFDGGRRSAAADGLAGYRLLAESATPVSVLGFETRRYKLFGVVPGARVEVRGAPPGATVTAAARLRSNTGREFAWSAAALCDESGVASLSLPYATGANGLVVAGPYSVEAGGRAVSLAVSEDQIATGGKLSVDLQKM